MAKRGIPEAGAKALMAAWANDNTAMAKKKPEKKPAKKAKK